MAPRLVLPILFVVGFGAAASAQEIGIDLQPQISPTLDSNAERPGAGLEVDPGIAIDTPLGGMRTEDGVGHRTEINAPQISRNGTVGTGPAAATIPTPTTAARTLAGSLAELDRQGQTLRIAVMDMARLAKSSQGWAMLSALSENQDGIGALRVLVQRRPEMSAALASSGFAPKDVVGISRNGSHEITLFVQPGA